MQARVEVNSQAVEEKISSSATVSIIQSLNIARKPPVLSSIKNDLINYYDDLKPDSGYIKDVEEVVHEAEAYLEDRVKKNKESNSPDKLGMVLDIDDTSLSNYPSLKKDDFSNTPAIIDARYHAANAPAIPPVFRLYKEAVDAGVSVFFISVRKPLDTNPTEDLYPYTEKSLNQAGYTTKAGLFIPKGDQLKQSSKDFKTSVRKDLTEKDGYKLILNVGDQDSDLDGGFAEHTHKLPNYVYSTAPIANKR